jgi:hypothetical protein
MITTNSNITAQHIVPVMHDNIKGAMCGISGVGIVALTSIPMEALALLTCNKEDCDGMVTLKSCAPLGANWGTTAKSDYFKASINHPVTDDPPPPPRISSIFTHRNFGVNI